MANGAYLRQLHRIFDGGTVAGLSEGQLLERFISRRDETAFEALVARHGPMVFGVCRRILRDPSDAEDAFQATFLVLVRQAHSIRGRDSLGGWLHRVAYRVAIRASANRRKPEHVELDSLSAPETADRDLIALIHEELDRLPSKYRVPIILCDLENHTHEEAAQALQWPLGTVKGRLSRARNLLKDRLLRRGVGAPALAVGVALGRDARAIVSPVLLDSTVRAALNVAAGKVLVAGAASAVAVGLAQGVMRTMFWHTMKWTSAALVALSLVGGAGVGTFGQGPGGEGKGAVVADEPKQVEPFQAPQSDPEPKADEPQTWQARFEAWKKALQGTWKMVDSFGGSLEGEALPFREKVVITGEGQIQLAEPGEADLEYGIVAIASKKGYLSPNFGDKRNQKYPCVFSLHGNSLAIVYTLPGGQNPNPTDLLPQQGRFIVWLERERSKPATPEPPPVASPDADITKLQGGWILWRSTSHLEGWQFDVGTVRNPLAGEMGSIFFIDGQNIRDNQTGNGPAPAVARIESNNSRLKPKQIDIRAVDNTLLPSRGIPVGKAIYVLEDNHFTICYDPVHPDRRPEQFPRDGDDLTNDTRVVSVYERLTPPAAATPPKAEAVPAKHDLRGRWKVVTMIRDGVEYPAPAAMPVQLYTGSVKGVMETFGSVGYGAEYTVNNKTAPMQIDYSRPQVGTKPPVLQLSIYRIDGDRLTTCTGAEGKERPTEFESTPGSGRILSIMKWDGPMTEALELKVLQARAKRFDLLSDPVRANAPDLPPEAPPAPLGYLPPPRPEPPSKEDLRGLWKLGSAVDDGKPVDVGDKEYDLVLTKSLVGEVGEDGLDFRSDYVIEANTNHVTFLRPQRGEQFKLHHCLFRIQGDELTLCRPDPELDQRPTDFVSPPGSDILLQTYKRVGPLTEEILAQLYHDRAELIRKLGTPPRGASDRPAAPPAPGAPMPPAATATHPDESLRGCWRLVSSIQGGLEQDVPKWTAVYADNWYGEINEKGLDFKGPYKVDKDKEPWRLEYVSETNGDVQVAGIYKIEGDRLTTCIAPVNGAEVMSLPSKFQSGPGSRYLLLTFEWAGPLTEDIGKQLQQSRDEHRLQREERSRKRTEAMAKLQPLSAPKPPTNLAAPAPVDLDQKRAEMEIEKEILEMEVESLKERVIGHVQNAKAQEKTIAGGENPAGEKFTPEMLKAMQDVLERQKQALIRIKSSYVEKSKELYQLNRKMTSLGEPSVAADPFATPSDRSPAAQRLAYFDRQIRLLQQKRDAYLMGLPDDQRQTLLKQLAP